MSKVSETVGWIVAIFAALGVAFGLAGHVSVSWGYEVFVASVQGSGGTAERFGPLFVSLLFFQNVSVAFFVGVIASLFIGLLFGSRFYEGRTAVLATGSGALLGFYVMVVFSFVIMSLGMSSPRGFGFAGALVPMILAGIPSGIVGSIAGYFGWVAN